MKNRRRTRCIHYAIQALEPRRLLATVVVVGSSVADAIDMQLSGSSLTVRNNGTAAITVDGVTVAAGTNRVATNATAISADVGSGNDSVTLSTNVTIPATIAGGANNDTLVGGAAADSLAGGDGNDFLDGYDGNDTLSGDTGTQTGFDTLYGRAGSDTLIGGNGGDALYGDRNSNSPASATYADSIDGGAGTDYLDGGQQADTLVGGSENDIFSNQDGTRDTVDGGTGSDRAQTGITGENENFVAVETIASGSVSVQALNQFRGFSLTLGGTEGDDVLAINQTVAGLEFTLNGLTFLYSNGVGEVFNGQLFGSYNILTIDMGGGNDTLECGLNLSVYTGVTIAGGAGNDVITLLGFGVAQITGGTGDDTLTGGSGNDRLLGGEGRDSLSGMDGADLLEGDDFNSTLPAATSGDTLRGGAGSDRLYGYIGDDSIFGDADDDELYGGEANDTLSGDDGNDYLEGGVGADSQLGGAGTDRVDYGSRTVPITADLDGAAGDDGAAGEGDSLDATIDILSGGSANDLLTGSDSNNTLDGNGGNDTLVGLGGDDLLIDNGLVDADSLNGGTGSDTADYSGSFSIGVTLDPDGVFGDDGQPGEGDTITTTVENFIGGSGNDSITGSSVDNVINGGAGNDTLTGLGGNDTVSYAFSSRSIVADLDPLTPDGDTTGGEADIIASDFENITGGNGNDTLTGSAGANVLLGGPGSDVLNGAAGQDTLIGETGADVLAGGADVDVVSYAERLASQPVSVDMDGATGDDGQAGEGDSVSLDVEILIGGAGDDSLVGNASSNNILGGPGDDTVQGLGGADDLRGDAGFDFASYADRGPTEPVAVDIANDFNDDGAVGEFDTVELDIEGLTGGEGNDLLVGYDVDNLINGQGGDDTIIGGSGNDTFSGGAGMDLIDYSTSPGPIRADFDPLTGDGRFDPNVGTQQELDVFGQDIEQLRGGPGNDVLSASTGGAKSLFGGEGNDAFYAAGGKHAFFGEGGDDLFSVHDLASVSGGSGDDQLIITPPINLASPPLLDVNSIGLHDRLTLTLAANTVARVLSGNLFDAIEIGVNAELRAGTDVVLRTRRMFIAASGSLVVGKGAIIDFGPGEASPRSIYESQIATATPSRGIRPLPDAPTGKALGIAEASDVLGPAGGTFAGQQVDGSAVLVRLTIRGDANVDGVVNIIDFARMASKFNQFRGWQDGDFNYDGKVTITDFALLAANFNQSAGDAPRTSRSQSFALHVNPNTAEEKENVAGRRSLIEALELGCECADEPW